MKASHLCLSFVPEYILISVLSHVCLATKTSCLDDTHCSGCCAGLFPSWGMYSWGKLGGDGRASEHSCHVSDEWKCGFIPREATVVAAMCTFQVLSSCLVK